MLRQFAVAATLLSLTTAAGAQAAPPDWRWGLDAPARHVTQTDSIPAGAFSFVTMAPGWHVTMGPGAVLYDPRNTIAGRFTLQSRLAMFPGEVQSEYGVFVGGRELDGAGRSWVAFVVRRDGSAAVIRHGDGRNEELLPWTKHPAVKPGAAANVVRVSQDTAVHFIVNDSTIAVLPTNRVRPEGVFGFRIGAALNLHITTLDITHRLAPVPARR